MEFIFVLLQNFVILVDRLCEITVEKKILFWIYFCTIFRITKATKLNSVQIYFLSISISMYAQVHLGRSTCYESITWEAQWPIGFGVGLRIKQSSVRIRPWPLRWVLGQGSLLPLSQGEAFTLASISYLAILVKYMTGKKKKKKKKIIANQWQRVFLCVYNVGRRENLSDNPV